MAEELENLLASMSLRTSVSAEKGRCLIAASHFSPGHIILEQEPYAYVVNRGAKGKRCNACFKKLENLKRCSKCQFVWYCSPSCQKEEWSIHKQECRIIIGLPEGKSHLVTPSLQLMLRLLIKRRLQFSKEIAETGTDNYELVAALLDHMSDMDENRLVLYAQMANLVKEISNDDMEIRDITLNFCRFACNAHTICDEELKPNGTGLYPVISIINHSCSPNAVLTFEGRYAMVRALEDIDEGTEITVSYVEVGMSTISRQRALKEQYFFSCNCKRCSLLGTKEGLKEDGRLEGFLCPNKNCNGFSLPEEKGELRCVLCLAKSDENKVKLLICEVDKILEDARCLQNQGKLMEAKNALQKAEALQESIWNPNCVHLMHTRDSLLKICMSLHDWKSALHYCQATIPAYEGAYPPLHPLLGLQFYVLGKLQWYIGNSLEALEALTKAYKILYVTHGSRSKLFEELRAMLNEAEAEVSYRHLNDSEIPYSRIMNHS